MQRLFLKHCQPCGVITHLFVSDRHAFAEGEHSLLISVYVQNRTSLVKGCPYIVEGESCERNHGAGG